MYLKNVVNHFKLITKHRWVVFKLCCKVGEPWRGFMHDLSKYSPTEFFESVKYYNGKHSPIMGAKKAQGYSKAWLHHKGRNRHHSEYWVDETAPDKTPIMPYPFAVEMMCDKLAAGMVYQGKDFTKEYELSYWKKEREYIRMSENMKKFVDEILEKVADVGVKEAMTKTNLKSAYEKYCK